MRKIELTKGKQTIIDDQDYRYLNQWKWMCSSHGYAVRSVYLGGGRKNRKQQYIRMHRIITNAPEGLEVDHINGDKLDNRKTNLRTVNRTTNQHNRKINRNNTSGFTGVSWHKTTNRWQSRITNHSKQIRLGYFRLLADAAKAYREAKSIYHG